MDVYHPEQPNGYGIIFISGSGWTSELNPDARPLKESGQEKIYALPLARAGYTVFSINHRAAPRFRHPAQIEDAQRAVRFVRHNAARYGIRPDRIGATGGSSGGHLLGLLATLDGAGDPNASSSADRESARVQAVVIRAGHADLRAMPRTALFGFNLDSAREGSVEYRQLFEASPLTYVSGDDPPYLMIHGDADPSVPDEQSKLMLQALHQAGVKSELLTVPGGGHGPRFTDIEEGGKPVQRAPQNPPYYVGAMVKWFDQYLKAH